MRILNCSSKLQLLEGVLRSSLPEALPVYGAVMHINRGNPAQHEVVVDSWPEFKAVLTRPHKEVMNDSLDCYVNLHAAFYREVNACQALLDNGEAINWSTAFQLQGLQDGVYEAARDIAEARRVHLKPYCYQTVFHPSLPTLGSRLKRDSLHFGILSPSHAALLDETWSLGGNVRSLRFLETLIRYFPNSCLMNKEGQLVCWDLSDPLACLKHLYTLPQYRGQGCAELVTQSTAEKLYARGFPVYGGVLPENLASQQSMRRLGFHFLPYTQNNKLFKTSLQCVGRREPILICFTLGPLTTAEVHQAKVLPTLPILTADCPAALVWPAMLILTCPSKLQLLEGMLQRSLPQALPACGALMHINRGNPAQHEVLVDSWPEFKAVLTRPRKKTVKDKGDFYANLYATFYRDVDACRAMLENAEAVDWSEAFQLQGIQNGVYEVAKDLAGAKGVHLEPYLYQTLLHPDLPAPSQCRLKIDTVHYGTLDPAHATTLNEAWDFGGNSRSLRYLDFLIRTFPSACLMDKERRLVSWSLSDPYGCLAHGYTFPQYQGQGCQGAVQHKICRKLHASGFPLYCGVLPENQPAKEAMKRQGFHILSETYYMLIVTPALDLKE